MELMEQRINDGLSPYRIFSRAEWAARREDTPMTLTPAEIADLKAFNDQLDMREVEEIYLPVSRRRMKRSRYHCSSTDSSASM